MRTLDDELIVLRTHPVRESDLIVHFLAKELGRGSALARGAKRSKKRFAGALDSFANLKAGLTPNRSGDSYSLDHVAIIDAFGALRRDLATLYLASYFCELCDRLLAPSQFIPGVYELLRFFLERLVHSDASNKQRHFFEVRLLTLVGICPDWNACPVNKPTREAMMLAASCKLEELGRVRFTPSMAREARPILLASIQEQLNANPRSLKLLESEVKP